MKRLCPYLLYKNKYCWKLSNQCVSWIYKKKKKDWDCKQSKFHYIFTVSFTASIYRMAIWTSAYFPAAWTIHLWRTRTGAVLSKITIWTSYMEKMCLIKYLYINKILIILIFMFLAKIITYMYVVGYICDMYYQYISVFIQSNDSISKPS